MREEYRKLVDEIVEAQLEHVLAGEAIKGGHNGPYYDYEMPVRNISHWICTFEKYLELTSDSRFYDAIKLLSETYNDPTVIEEGKSVICRVKYKKDKTNGVMGQAWVIEGLLACARVLKDESFYDTAVKLFMIQRFDEKDGMWSVIENDGRDFGYDVTFNHQLWYAAAGSLILDYKYNETIDRQVKHFLKKAEDFFIVHSTGLIFHYVKYKLDYTTRRWYDSTWKLTEEGLNHKVASLVYKEEGYHTFSVYAFALMYDRYKDEKFFSLDKVKASIEYALRESSYTILDEANPKLDSSHIGKNSADNLNAYAYPYNSPAFEFALIDKVFGNAAHEELLNMLMEKQFKYTYDAETKTFSLNNEDKNTLTARIYELVRAF